MDDRTRSYLLDRLERGQIDVGQVIRALEGEAHDPHSRARRSQGSIRSGWWLMLALPGAAVVSVGARLVHLEGLWLVPAILLLLLGGVVVSLGLLSVGSPWMRLRVRSPDGGRLRSFGLHLPLPVRAAAWIVR